MKKIVWFSLLIFICSSMIFAGGSSGGAPAEAPKDDVIQLPTIMGGTYMDWMKTVYNRAGHADVVQIPLTAYDKNNELHGIAAESWSVSADGLTWTFELRRDLRWSDGEELNARDFVFALERAVTQGYDFAWYWSWAGGVKNWSEVENDNLPLSEFGVSAPDDYTLQVETDTPKPYFPGVASLWFPVPRAYVEQYGDEWASSVENYVSSGPFMLTEWVRGDRITVERNPYYNAPWPGQVERIIFHPALDDPAVSFPAYLAGDVDSTDLNAGQLAYASERFPDQLKSSLFYGIFYLAFDYDEPPFDNKDVRSAIFYAVDREKLTNTVLRNVAIPARSLYAPGFPGYSESNTELTGFDPERARRHLAAAGYPDGEGFPSVELWWRIEGGIAAPIVGPTAEYLQAQLKEVLNIDIEIQGLELRTWMDGLANRENNFWLAPYMYDYVDASNFASIFIEGGRHHWVNERYTSLVGTEANAIADWEKRFPLYEEAERILIEEAAVTYLVHPITNKLWKPYIVGEGVEPNRYGDYTAQRFYISTHIGLKK